MIIIFLIYSTLLTFISSVPPSTLVSLFANWTKTNSIRYSKPQIWLYRFNVFKDNLNKVQTHNQRYQLGQVDYLLGMNSFADLTQEQFSRMYGSKRIKEGASDSAATLKCTGTVFDAPNPPQEVDWTIKAVTPVQDERPCGCSWAFTAIGAIQGLYALKKGKLQKFSQQQMIDCSGDYGNQGCNGGFMDQGFWYAIDSGLTSNNTYAYTGVKSTSCKYVPTMRIAGFTECARIPSGNYKKLLSAVVQQPTSVAVDASDMQLYASGIYNGNCTSDINRGMLLVGYGGQNTTMYWKLKNSLGDKWGDKGYIYISREETDGDGKCGIQLAASVPQSVQ